MHDTPFIETWFHLPPEADWRPLRAVARLSQSTDALLSFDPDEFMYMGYVESRDEPLRIHLYKHVDTRRYLNLDDAGHAYRYCGPFDDEYDLDDPESGGRYRLHRTLGDALDVAVGELAWMRPWPG